MAKLPNADRAIIDTEKIRDYVLSRSHPVGRFKAAVFGRFGYFAESWEIFERNLRELVLSMDVTKVENSRFGQKFIVEGPLVSPSGETMQIVSVWIILKGENVPRFITVYPRGLL